jgi:predicted acylesterase/phospholipase RssA
VFGCATETSVAPARPYVFRTYEFPPGSDSDSRAEKLLLHPGSSKHKVWQAVRASSAAPYYLDDFCIGKRRFVDGAVSVNNPSVVAVQEARMLYPDVKVDCVVSLGVGIVPTAPRAKAVSSYFETGSAVIEGASTVSRAHEALSCMLDMSGCLYER